jgi:hypothetical protein
MNSVGFVMAAGHENPLQTIRRLLPQLTRDEVMQLVDELHNMAATPG